MSAPTRAGRAAMPMLYKAYISLPKAIFSFPRALPIIRSMSLLKLAPHKEI